MASSDRSAPLLEVSGIINPLTARYLVRGLAEAERADAPFALIQLDTPGGTMDAMREIVQAILASAVPVVVYVAPEGARAASAGVFVTAAADVAAMAPGTHIGAAHPVAIGRGGQKDPTMESKAVNDAAAMARAIAERRGRNADWLERAVRQSVALTAVEARDQGVIDLVAGDIERLMSAIDGRIVQTATGPRTLGTKEVSVERRPMTLAERIAQVITDPNIAYLLLSLGLIGLAAELYHPGTIFPGVTGVICLILAFTAFGSLPVNWAGVALVGLGLTLIFLDALSAGIGLLSLGGVVALVLGSLFLYRPFDSAAPAAPALAVSPWLIGIMAAFGLAFSTIVVRAAWRMRHAPVRSGPQALVGREGVAVSPLAPAGRVRVDSEVWSAVADDAVISPGEHVRVQAVEGVILHVAREEAA